MAPDAQPESPAPVQLAVIAKAPVAGAVKTRLCPPYTLRQAARLAAAALTDVVAAVSATPAAGQVLLLAGDYPTPPGWRVVAQRGDGLAARLANGYADIGGAGVATLIIAADTPQVSPLTLADAVDRLGRPGVDAVLGLTEDGGFWALGLRQPGHGALLREVPMSTPTTGAATARVLRQHGLRVVRLPRLRDVDSAADAAAVAAAHPRLRFAAALRGLHAGAAAAHGGG